MQEAELCDSEQVRKYIGSISVDNILELVIMIVMMLTMLTLIFYILYQIRTKNIWQDLKGRQKYMLQALIAFCFLGGLIYLVSGISQIIMYRLRMKGDIDYQNGLFGKMFTLFFITVMSLGICINNILLIISYIWQYIICNYFGGRGKNLLLVVFLVLICGITGLTIGGLWTKISPNGRTLIWVSNLIGASLAPLIALICCLRFLNKIKLIQANQNTLKSLYKYVFLLIFSSVIRFSYTLYAIFVSRDQNINYFSVENNCNRIYQWGICINVFVNLVRFFLPIFIIIRVFGKTKNKQQQSSLYQSLHQKPRADSQSQSEIE